MIAGMTWFEICCYFLIYSFFGWIIEVVYHAVKLGKIINRGFLNGPVCPVYGFGALAAIAFSNLLKRADPAFVSSSDSGLGLLFLFLGGMLLATAVEFVAGFLLDRLFHARWWDYSDKPFNVHGYICLEFSIIWGLVIVFCVRVVQPVISLHTPAETPSAWMWVAIAVCYLVLFVDLLVTVSAILGFNRKLRELDRIRSALRKPSDHLSTVIGEQTFRTQTAVGEASVQAALGKAELRERVSGEREKLHEEADLLRAEQKGRIGEEKLRLERSADELRTRAEQLADSMLEGKNIRRLMKAFPNVRHEEMPDTLQELIERLRKKT